MINYQLNTYKNWSKHKVACHQERYRITEHHNQQTMISHW